MGSGPLRGVGSPRLRFGERAYCLLWEITETEGEIWQVTGNGDGGGSSFT